MIPFRVLTGRLAGAAFATMALAATGATNITEYVSLAEDADWRGLGTVTVRYGAGIEIAGHTLKVDGITGGFATPVDATTSSRTGTVEVAKPIYSGNAAFLFDDDIRYSGDAGNSTDETRNHRVCVYGQDQFPFEVTYDFGEGNETCIKAYKMYYKGMIPAERAPERAPKNWTFLGSNDKENWTTLDTRENVTDWQNPDMRTFSFSNIAAFRYYKLSVAEPVSGNCLELYQLEYFPEVQDVCDETGNDTNRVTSSTVSSGNAAFLFDNDFRYQATPSESSNQSKNHRMLASGKPFWVTYDFGEDNVTILNGYRIYFKSSNISVEGGRAPRDWMFQGSNDNENWISLDVRSGETNWVKGCAREFHFSNATPYRYDRLNVTDYCFDNYLEMYQLEYLSRPMVVSKAIDAQTDVTEPGEEHVNGSSTPLYGSVTNLFDNIFNYNYDANHVNDHRIVVHKDKLPFDVVYDFGEGANIVVASYGMYHDSAIKEPTRAPSAWTFDGSDDGSSWTMLDSRTGETQWNKPDMRTFLCANKTPYRYYRLHLTATNGDNYLELYQLEYFGQRTGMLVVDTPANASQTNNHLAVGGQLRLIKDGAGTFTVAEPNQVYSGGTIVSNGTLRAGLDGGSAPLGLLNANGESDFSVTVCSNGTFDVDGLGGWWHYPILLSGGTLACMMPADAAPEDTFRNIALDADSRLAVGGNFVMGDGTGTAGQLDLGGHTLTASVASNGLWTLNVSSVTAGTIAFDLAKDDAYAGKKVLAWESGSKPAGVSFTRAEGSSHGVAAQEDGVYVIAGGTMVIFR